MTYGEKASSWDALQNKTKQSRKTNQQNKSLTFCYTNFHFTAPDPNCPGNQRASSSSLQENGVLVWNPPPNVNPDGYTFNGEANVQMPPGASYLFTQVYTDGQGNEQTCEFTGSVSCKF